MPGTLAGIVGSRECPQPLGLQCRGGYSRRVGWEAGRRGEGRSSPPGLSDEGFAMAGGGMPAVSRGMMQESPLILSSRPGIETWLSPDHGVLRCEGPPDHPPSPPASSNSSPGPPSLRPLPSWPSRYSPVSTAQKSLGYLCLIHQHPS